MKKQLLFLFSALLPLFKLTSTAMTASLPYRKGKTVGKFASIERNAYNL